jgi:hypothetical protein
MSNTHLLILGVYALSQYLAIWAMVDAMKHAIDRVCTEIRLHQQRQGAEWEQRCRMAARAAMKKPPRRP